MAANRVEGRLLTLTWLVLCVFFLSAAAGAAAEPPESEVPGDPLCPLGEAVETDGVRRLALVVGVGDYASDKVPDLRGPVHDAKRIHELLTGPNGYGFPRETSVSS